MSSAGEISGTKKGGRYVRDDLDFFVEPDWVVDLLFDNELFFGAIWDPACGSCTIERAGNRHGYEVWSSDIADRGQNRCGEDQFGRHDFMSDEPYSIGWDDNLVFNPPFKLADAFIRRALEIAKHKVAALVQAKFLYSQVRHKLFTEHPPARIYHLSSRPSMPPGDLLLAGKVKATGGKLDYCWVVWSKDHKGQTTTHWLLRKVNGQKAQEKEKPDPDRGEQGGTETTRHHATPRARAEAGPEGQPDRPPLSRRDDHGRTTLVR